LVQSVPSLLHKFPQRHVLSIWPECHEHREPSVGIGAIHVRMQDRAVSHRHISILFQKHFILPGHGLPPFVRARSGSTNLILVTADIARWSNGACPHYADDSSKIRSGDRGGSTWRTLA